MDAVAAAPPDPELIYRYRDGVFRSQLFTAAVVVLDLFNWLEENPCDFVGLCEGLELAARPADVLLTLVRAMGLVSLDSDGVLRLTAIARDHLLRRSPRDVTAYFASLGGGPVVRDMVQVLRTGVPANWAGGEDALDWHAGMVTDEFSRSFTAAMDARGHYLGEALAGLLDLHGRRRLLDVAGGSGVYACRLAACNPGLTAIVLEQAPVDAIAREAVARRGFADRVEVLSAEMFSGRWPEDCDAHLFSNVLHDWDVPEVKSLLARSYDSMPGGGMVVVHEAFLNRAKDGPLPVAEYSAILMHATRGRCYGIGEMEDFLRVAGFVRPRYRTTAADRGFFIAQKPQEPVGFAP
ncbi:MAG TPA: methyltransferase [Verrucomicrobiales bacterium]|nr:methyltransferase [Verrucomicrobiales bacterium]